MKIITPFVAAVIALLTICLTGAAQQQTYAQGQTKLYAEEQAENFSDVTGSVGLDLVSRYLWRGTDKGNITILPFGQLNWRGAYAKLSGATGFDKDDAKEINITLGYDHQFNETFTLGVMLTDYWTSGKDYSGRSLYFEWDPVKNGHQLEVGVGLKFRHFTLNGYTMVWGNDFKYDSLDDTERRTNGKRAFSTFIEARVPFYMGGIDWDVCAGFTPFASACTIAPGEEIAGFQLVRKESFYSDKASLIMASIRATKRLEMGDVKVPIFAELHTNPYMKRANFLVGVSVLPF